MWRTWITLRVTTDLIALTEAQQQISNASAGNALERMDIRHLELSGFVRLDRRVRARRAPRNFDVLAHVTLLKMRCPKRGLKSKIEQPRRIWVCVSREGCAAEKAGPRRSPQSGEVVQS